MLHAISPAGPPATGTWSRHRRVVPSDLLDQFPGAIKDPGRSGRQLDCGSWGTLQNGKISGTYRFTLFAPTSEPAVVESGTGKVSGRRISA